MRVRPLTPTWEMRQGDVLDRLREIPNASVRCVVTSPPCWGLRDYGVEGQLGLEVSLPEFVEALRDVFRDVRRVLADDGTLWLNLGDKYASSWGAQSRGGPPSDTSTLRGNGHIGGGPKMASLSAVQIAAHPKRTRTGSIAPGSRLKPKDLVGVPWRVAFALQDDGWWLRSDIVWHKMNPMPESVTDRPTRAHEFIFLLAKSERYFYDADAVREAAISDHPSSNGYARRERLTYADDNGARGSEQPWEITEWRNRRDVWSVTTKPYAEAHFATFPPDLIEPCILAGSEPGDMVLDPFAGSGTTLMVALRHGRSALGIGLNPEYVELARRRIVNDAPLFNQLAETTIGKVERPSVCVPTPIPGQMSIDDLNA